MSTPKTMLTDVRSELDDKYIEDFPEDNLWSDADLCRYMAQAEAQWAYKTELFRDGDHPLTKIQMATNVGIYRLSDRIVKIVEASIPNYRRVPLIHQPHSWITQTFLDWRYRRGIPDYYCTDYKPEHILLFPTPAVADLVRGPAMVEMYVERLPISSIDPEDLENSSFETPERYHHAFMNWIKHLAYSKHDTETLDLEKAKYYKEAFEQDTAMERQAIDKRKWVPRVVRMGSP